MAAVTARTAMAAGTDKDAMDAKSGVSAGMVNEALTRLVESWSDSQATGARVGRRQA